MSEQERDFSSLVLNDPKYIGFSVAISQVLEEYSKHVKNIQDERLPFEKGRTVTAEHLEKDIEGIIAAHIKPLLQAGTISIEEANARRDLVLLAMKACSAVFKDSKAEYMRLDGERRAVQKFADVARNLHSAKRAEEERKLRQSADIEEIINMPIPEPILSVPQESQEVPKAPEVGKEASSQTQDEEVSDMPSKEESVAKENPPVAEAPKEEFVVDEDPSAVESPKVPPVQTVVPRYSNAPTKKRVRR